MDTSQELKIDKNNNSKPQQRPVFDTDELEARWRENPASVDKSWVNFFRLLGARRRAVRPACGLSMTASNRLFAHALPHQTRAPPPRHWPKHLTPSSMAQRPRWLSTPPRRRRVRQVVR